MVDVATPARRIGRTLAASAAVVFSSYFVSGALTPAFSADTQIIKRGDAVVTGFSGTRTEKDVPPEVHPLDRTFIDLQGSAAQIFDLSVLGTAPRGQLSDVPSKLKIKAAETGQVFGITLDSDSLGKAPNAYLTSTSMFGLQIIADDGKGAMDRLLAGAPGAKWMPGQFGLDKGGTPGAIWKIDGRTGAVTLFANVTLDNQVNAGPGLGNISYDPKTNQVFVSDLETGMIHRFTLDGKERDLFDHGVDGRKVQGLDQVPYDASRRMSKENSSFNIEDTATWGFADERRRVFGLAVSNNRLYYGVAEGPAVWSVSIDDEGDFGNDARIELELKNTPPGTNITDILFDGAGVMYLSERGAPAGSYDYTTFATPQQAVVVRYMWDEKAGRWSEKPQEYAIGLTPEFHGAQGGIALNYGYDKHGNIDFGKCRQTLWTTGEHLREGDDTVRVSTGGAKIVHGLQGNYKSRVRPDNEPPYETWFTDYDGRFEDAEAFGHIGDVAIYEPCEGEREREPQERVETIAPMVPPLDDPGLILEKRCFAGAIGGKIRCSISVRNVSNHIPSQDIKIVDVTKIMIGPGTGTLVPIVSFAVPNSAISCALAPTPDFWCSIPATLLGPGEIIGIDVWVDTHDLALAGNVGFRNCAILQHPDGYGRACAEGGTDIIVEKIGPATCLPGGACKFGLRIANGGLLPFDGDVLVADAMFIGGGVPVAPVTAVSPPFTCISGNTSQLPFTCLTHLSLAPGEEHIHWVDVTMPAPGGYWAENCFGVLDPALVPVGPVPPVLIGGPGGSSNPACVWVEVPAPTANLKIEKKIVGTGQCDKIGGDLFCKYDVSLTNQNTVAFNDVIKFEEKVPPGANLTLISPPWGCGGVSPNYVCDTGGAVAIPAGGTISTQVTLQISVPDVEAIGCSIPNEVKISTPAAGTPLNLDGSDDIASATAWTFGLSWVDLGGVTHTICDPTNLKVKKVATGPCTQSGSGWQCGYEVTVTNAGPDPFKGPVKLDEKFGVSPQSVSFGGDFTCSGAGATYKCQTGTVSLAKGDSLTLNVTAKVADNGTCRMPNTATLTFPVAGSKANGSGADDTASATAKVPSERCTEKPSSFIPPVSIPRCADGRPRRLDGSCPCPLGTRWDNESRSCQNPQPRCYDQARIRDNGTCCPYGTVYDGENDRCRVPRPECRDPERRMNDGSCCPLGTVTNESGSRCVPTETACPPDTRWNYITRTCVPTRPTCNEGERYNWREKRCEPPHRWCPPGTHPGRDGDACIRDEGDCPRGTRFNRETHQCEGGNHDCRDSEHYDREKRACVPNDHDDCTQGQHYDREKRACVPNAQPECRDNQHYDRWRHACVPNDHGDCGQSQHYDREKHACVPNEQTDKCPDGSPHLAGGACRCPQNRTWNADSGHCERKDLPPTSIQCLAGFELINGKCVKKTEPKDPPKVPGKEPPVERTCPEGKHRVGNACLPDKGIPIVPPNGGDGKTPGKDPSSERTCPEGKHRVDNACLPDQIIVIPPAGGTKVPGKDPGTPQSTTCPEGQHAVGKACIPNRPNGGGKADVPDCKAGTHRLGKSCVPDVVIKPEGPVIKIVPKHRPKADDDEPKRKPKHDIEKPRVHEKIEKIEPKTRERIEPKKHIDEQPHKKPVGGNEKIEKQRKTLHIQKQGGDDDGKKNHGPSINLPGILKKLN